MYLLTVTTTRPDASYEFWWTSGRQPDGFFDRDIARTDSGDLMPSHNSIDDTGLISTRKLLFKDQATFLRIIQEDDALYSDVYIEKNAYNALHGHIETKVYTTV